MEPDVGREWGVPFTVSRLHLLIGSQKASRSFLNMFFVLIQWPVSLRATSDKDLWSLCPFRGCRIYTWNIWKHTIGGSDSKESSCNAGDVGFNPWVGKIPWRRVCQPTPVFLPGESPWTEEPGKLQSMGLQRHRTDWVTKPSTEW